MHFLRGALALCLLCIVSALAASADARPDPGPDDSKMDSEKDPEANSEQEQPEPTPPPCSRSLLKPISEVLVTDMPGRTSDSEVELGADWRQNAADMRDLSAQSVCPEAEANIALDGATTGWIGTGLGVFLAMILPGVDAQPTDAIAATRAWIRPLDFSSIWLLSDTTEAGQALTEIDSFETMDGEIR